mmetsp:Transcript_55235/g.164371  ORF Transcript_55235/g.164371 Transcript_55235/m.164371 type:complete len:97 (+) Transcript_55235:102-392(+)
MFSCCGGLITPERVRSQSDQIFARYDKDDSGTISKEELADALSKACSGLSTVVPMSQCIRLVDEDGDGSLSKDEFYKLVCKALKKAGVTGLETETA